LRFNADFPHTPARAFFARICQYRLALHGTCLVVVWIAAPLASVIRGGAVLSSVAAAVILVFFDDFLVHLFLALGEGPAYLHGLAAWTRHLVSRQLSLLLYLRASNREPPSFHLFTARRIVAHESSPKRGGRLSIEQTFCAATQRPLFPGEYFLHSPVSRRRWIPA